MISIARTFGAPESVPAGSDGPQRVHRGDVGSRSVPETLETMCITCE